MALPVTWQAVPAYVTILFTLGLAGLLLWLDFQKRANRAFALLLLLRGGALLVVTLRNAATTTAEFEFFQRLLPYFQLPVALAFVYFMLVFPRPITWFGRRAWGGWALLAMGLLLELAYALDHSLYYTYERGAAASAMLNAGNGYRYLEFGPLAAIGQLSVPMACLAAAVFARSYLREPPGSARFSLVLIIAGLILSSLFFGVQWIFACWELFTDPDAYPWLPWGWGFALVPLLTLPTAFVALMMLWVGSRRTASQQDDVETRRLLWTVPVPLVSAVLISYGAQDVFGDELSVFTIGLWRLLMPVLVTYALLRYRLFDLDLKARLTIHYGSVAAVFGIVYFFASETAEGLISDRAGDWAGLLAAGALTLVVKPIEKLGGQLARRVMPGAKPLDELDEGQRKKMYQDRFDMALQDGRLTKNEKKMLLELQQRLGLDLETPVGGRKDAARRRRVRA